MGAMTMRARGGPAAPQVAAWRTRRAPMVVGAAVAGLCLWGAWSAFGSRALEWEAAWVAVAVAAAAIAWWAGSGKDMHLALAASLVGLAVGWYVAQRTGLIVASGAAGTALLAGGTYRRRVASRAARLEGLAVVLLPAVRDSSAPEDVLMAPSRGGYPVLWHLPSGVLWDEQQQAAATRLVDRQLGGTHRLREVEPGLVEISEIGESDEAGGEEQPDDEVRLSAILVQQIGQGARITKTIRDEQTGELTEVLWTWPPKAAAKMAEPATAGRVLRTLPRALPGEWVPTLDPATDTGRLRRVPALPQYVPHPPRDRQLTLAQVAFGIASGGVLLKWDLNADEPHMLIVGRTGAGKTNFVRGLIVALGMVKATMVLIDPKRSGLKGLEALPGVAGRYTPRDTEQMLDEIHEVYAEMHRRYEAVDRGEVTPDELERLVLVVDEGRTLYELAKSHWNLVEKPRLAAEAAEDKSLPKPAGTEHPVMEEFRGILRLGREARVNVVFITQQADADWLSTDARQNFGIRVALGNLDDEGAGMLYGRTVRVPQLPTLEDGRAIKGRGWVSIGGARPRQMQAYYTPPPSADQQGPGDREILDTLGIKTIETTVETDTQTTEVAEPVICSHSVVQDEKVSGHTDEERSLRAGELAAGSRVRLEVASDGVPELVELVDVDDDPDDEDHVALTYVREDGALGVLSVPRDEVLTALA